MEGNVLYVFQVHGSVSRQMYDASPTDGLQQGWECSDLRLWRCNSLAVGSCGAAITPLCVTVLIYFFCTCVRLNFVYYVTLHSRKLLATVKNASFCPNKTLHCNNMLTTCGLWALVFRISSDHKLRNDILEQVNAVCTLFTRVDDDVKSHNLTENYENCHAWLDGVKERRRKSRWNCSFLLSHFPVVVALTVFQ